MSLFNLKAGGETQQQQQQQRKCPNEPVPELDHKVMSKAERRRAAKNEPAPTKEQREKARENLQELRRKMRHLKSHGWRGKVNRNDRNVVKRERAGEGEGKSYLVTEDGAAYDDEESHVLESRMGVSRVRKGAGGEDSTAAAATGSKRNATGMKKHKVDEDSW